MQYALMIFNLNGTLAKPRYLLICMRYVLMRRSSFVEISGETVESLVALGISALI